MRECENSADGGTYTARAPGKNSPHPRPTRRVTALDTKGDHPAGKPWSSSSSPLASGEESYRPSARGGIKEMEPTKPAESIPRSSRVKSTLLFLVCCVVLLQAMKTFFSWPHFAGAGPVFQYDGTAASRPTAVGPTFQPRVASIGATSPPTNQKTIATSELASRPAEATSHRTPAKAQVSPPCSWGQLNRIIPFGRWRTKTPEERATDFESNCKFLKARYHCNNTYTTAANYVFEHDKAALRKQRCTVPTELESFEKLAAESKSLLLCGDSHTFQIYHRLLCKHEAHLEMVDIREKGRGEGAKYAKDGDFPHCHGDKPTVDLFYGDDPERKSFGICAYKKKGVSCARFKLPGQVGSEGLVVCAYYGRPDTHKVVGKRCQQYASAGVQFPYNSDATSRNDEAAAKSVVRPFDVVYANTYVDLKVLLESFNTNNNQASRFQGKVVLMSKYEEGYQSSLGVTEINQSLDAGTPDGQYPFETGLSDALVYKWRGALAPRAYKADVEAGVLDVTPILESRSNDAKSTMYPIRGIKKGSKTGTYEVCCPSMDDFQEKRCSCGTDFYRARACQNRGLLGERPTCGQDSHFCLPGPLSDVSRVMFSGMVAATIQQGATPDK